MTPLIATTKEGEKRMRVACLSNFAAIAAILASLGPDVRSEEISVTLRAPESTYCLGDAVGLELTFRNTSHMPIVVYAGFDPKVDEARPETAVVFQIIDPDGLIVPRSPDSRTILRRQRPTYRHFRQLSPGWFFGGLFYVNREPYDYRFGKIGRHRIRALVHFQARSWLRGIDPELPLEGTRRWFGLNLVVGGVVETNEISIQIQRKGACEENNEVLPKNE